jgi:hypothetical protein
MSDVILTIDPPATRERILSTYKNMQEYADARPFKYVTLQRLLSNGLGPRSSVRSSSVYQWVLRIIEADGLLVKADAKKEAA